MSKIIVGVFFLCLCISSIKSEGKCLPNSSLKQCGSTCERTCEKPVEIFCNIANPESCPLECRCDKGFVRHPNGSCVPPEECDD